MRRRGHAPLSLHCLLGPCRVLGLGLGLGCTGAPPAPLPPAPTPAHLTHVATTYAGPALQVTVHDGDDGSLLPSRIIIKAIKPTKTPNFRSDGATPTVLDEGVLGVPEGVLLVTGQGRVPIAAGTYDLMFLQGPEYEAVHVQVNVKRQVVPVDVTLSHSVRTDGWLAADMHIHSNISYDAQIHPMHRVISEVTSGISVLVPTEHAFHYDFTDEIQALGYEGRAVSMAGSEYGFAEGHAGVYPVVFERKGFIRNKDYGGGAPAWQHYPIWLGHSAEIAFPEIHALPGGPLVVINHPRLAPDLGYFRNIGWPHQPKEALGTATLFDGLEVLSGYENAPSETTTILRDWFALLNSGHHVVGLGNSDTHRLDRLRAGYPRTFLRMATDDPSQLTPSDLKDALRGMRAVASNGPWVNLWVEGHEVGDTIVPPTNGPMRVKVVADAAGWIDITKVLVYRNGALVKEIPITRRLHPALSQTISLPQGHDGWVVAMVVGDVPLPAEVIGTAKGGEARPFAFTNPVWLDADGDGKISIPPEDADAPHPLPFGNVKEDNEQEARIFTEPMHAPLDCDPSAWPLWLR